MFVVSNYESDAYMEELESLLKTFHFSDKGATNTALIKTIYSTKLIWIKYNKEAIIPHDFKAEEI